MATEKKDSARLDEKPPFFKNWKQVYAFVLAVFALLVILFYLFTINFS